MQMTRVAYEKTKQIFRSVNDKQIFIQTENQTISSRKFALTKKKSARSNFESLFTYWFFVLE